MSSSLRKGTLLVGVSIAAAVGFAGMAYGIPLGISEIARNHELDEGAKNHGAVVSEAAKHHGGGVSQLNAQSALFSQTVFVSPQSDSSLQSIPEQGSLLLFGAGMLVLAL